MVESDDTKEIRQRLEGIAASAPNISTKDALQHLVNEDPAVFCAVNRRLRGWPLTFQAAKQITDEAVKELQKVNPNNWESELKSRLLRHRPWMLKPLRDNHPHKAYEKARQVGVSELSLTEAIHFLSSRPSSERPKWVYCVPDDAEILTRRGWLKYNQIQPTDETLTLDSQTHITKWERVKSVAVFQWHGKLKAVGPFHCTPEHRWPVEARNSRTQKHTRKIVRTNELKQHHTIPRCAPHKHDRQPSVLTPRVAAILGWVVTDGCQWKTGTDDNKNTVMMSVIQSEKTDKHLRKIEKLLRAKRRNPREAPNGDRKSVV